MAFLVDQAFGYLRRSHEEDRLAHAYLITGPERSGKEDLALRLIALTNGATGSRLSAIRDAQVQVIRPESRIRRITIDQIRALERQLYLSGPEGKVRVGVICEADRLQRKSENAFLKTLEEPPARTLLLLLTAQPDQLLDTIRSRCLAVPLYAPGLHQPMFSDGFREVIEATGEALAQPERNLSRALVLAGAFTQLLRVEKEQIGREHEVVLNEEVERYGETTDGDWLKRRETYYKERTESDYVRRRTAMLEGLVAFVGDAVRLQAGYERLDFEAYADVARKVASRLNPLDLSRRLAALEELRSHLETTVQDSLAIQVGFIKAFS